MKTTATQIKQSLDVAILKPTTTIAAARPAVPAEITITSDSSCFIDSLLQ